MGKLTDAIKQKHQAAREGARVRLMEIVAEAVKDDAHYQLHKPAIAQKIDAALDEHVFKPLFT